MPEIHPTAIVEPGARLAASTKIGPYCLVGAAVELGEEVELISHAIVTGRTSVGARTRIFPFASIGHQPQDLKYRGEESRLEIGADSIIREHVTMNPGTSGGGMLTRTGDHCVFMVGVHVAHDCLIGDHVIMANNATLAGHVSVGEHAVLGGLCAVHQFVRIGRQAMIGGLTGVERDVIPFGSVLGDRARLAGLNIVGLQRRGFARDEIMALRNAYQILWGEGREVFKERLEAVEKKFTGSSAVRELLEFIHSPSTRGLCQPKLGNGG